MSSSFFNVPVHNWTSTSTNAEQPMSVYQHLQKQRITQLYHDVGNLFKKSADVKGQLAQTEEEKQIDIQEKDYIIETITRRLKVLKKELKDMEDIIMKVLSKEHQVGHVFQHYVNLGIVYRNIADGESALWHKKWEKEKALMEKAEARSKLIQLQKHLGKINEKLTKMEKLKEKEAKLLNFGAWERRRNLEVAIEMIRDEIDNKIAQVMDLHGYVWRFLEEMSPLMLMINYKMANLRACNWEDEVGKHAHVEVEKVHF